MQDLPFQTLTQFAALGITLVAGWFLGLASSSGGRRWRNLYEEEEQGNIAYRDETAESLRVSARRIRDLEAENAKLRAGAPVEGEGHSTAALAGAAIAGAAAGAVATHAAHEHHAEPAVVYHAEPVHVAPVAADHAEPAIAHGDHGAHAEPAIAAAHDSHGDDHHAPADAHHH